jgi:hypothetical protein
MGTAPRLAARPHATLATVTVTLLLAALACGLAALWLAGPAQAAPGSIVWKKTADPTRSADRLSLCARGPAGSLYAAGMTSTNRGDIWITRYAANGSVQWSKRWDDAGHQADRPAAMTVDAAGNVYVCGYVEGTATVTDSLVLKYSASGQKKWARVHSFGGYEGAQAIGLDAAGNVYVTGEEQPVDGSSLLYVARFAGSDGDVDWTWLQDTPAVDSNGLAIAVTGTGTCYAAGTIATAPDAADGYLVKLTGGVRDWEQVWDGPAHKTDWWMGAALSPDGGVVLGGSTGLSGPADFVAAHYSDAGVVVWSDTHDVPGTYTTEYFNDLAVAADGTILVCGQSDDYLGDSDVERGVLVRWSAAGAKTVSMLGSAKSPASFQAVTTDASGNAYVAGWLKRGASSDGLAARYTPAGTRSWITYVSLTSSSWDVLEEVTLGPSGGLYAVGTLNEEARNSRGVALRIRR